MSIDHIIEKIFDSHVSRAKIIILCESIDVGMVKCFKDNLSKRAFENLFFRQLYFLAKNKEYLILSKSIVYMKNHKQTLIDLFAVYHYELIFCDYKEGRMLFRSEIFDTLIQNNTFISQAERTFNNGISIAARYNMFRISSGDEEVKIDFVFQFFNKEVDASDGVNTYTMSLLSGDFEISSLSFLIGKDSLLISNIQNFKKADNYLFFVRYHKIFLYMLQKIARKSGIGKIISFSNSNHPCKYHHINDGFKGDYDNILQSIGMILSHDGYLHGNIKNINIKGINIYVKKNIEYHFDSIYKKLQLG